LLTINFLEQQTIKKTYYLQKKTPLLILQKNLQRRFFLRPIIINFKNERI